MHNYCACQYNLGLVRKVHPNGIGTGGQRHRLAIEKRLARSGNFELPFTGKILDSHMAGLDGRGREAADVVAAVLLGYAGDAAPLIRHEEGTVLEILHVRKAGHCLPALRSLGQSDGGVSIVQLALIPRILELRVGYNLEIADDISVDVHLTVIVTVTELDGIGDVELGIVLDVAQIVEDAEEGHGLPLLDLDILSAVLDAFAADALDEFDFPVGSHVLELGAVLHMLADDPVELVHRIASQLIEILAAFVKIFLIENDRCYHGKKDAVVERVIFQLEAEVVNHLLTDALQIERLLLLLLHRVSLRLDRCNRSSHFVIKTQPASGLAKKSL